MGDQPDTVYHSLPLIGAVVCCTSISPDVRQGLAQKCEEMGARSVLDLTSDVTHLICAAIGSAKYQYVAKMRPDVKVLRQDWVGVMYEQWLNGEDINPHDFEREYRYRTFSGLKISVTGIPDVAERQRIEAACLTEGATYHPDLTRSVTHLIAAAPTGKKYDFARINNINVVSSEWFNDSLERGMALGEQFYDPNLEPEKIGVGAKPAPVAQLEVADNWGKRRIRKTAEEKLGSQSQHIWDDIMGYGGASRPSFRDEWAERPSDDQRNTSQRPAVPTISTLVQQQSAKKQALFGETSLFIWGFPASRIIKVHSILQPLDARIVCSLEALAQIDSPTKFVLIPRQTLVKDYPSIPSGASVVTDWWLEKCLHFNRIFQPSSDDITTMSLMYPIEGLKGMDICITLFVETDLLHWTKLVPMLGATLHDSLTKSRTLLLTRAVPCSGEKFEYAIAQNIPVVRSDWLVECIRQDRRLPIEQFRIYKHTDAAEVDVDGKRKADNKAISDQQKKKQRRSDIGQAPYDDSTSGKQPQQIPERSSRIMGKSKNYKRLALEGCTLCVSRQLRNRKCELEKVAEDLGASILETLEEDSSLTHLIHASTSPSARDSTKYFTIARRIKGCSIVSPDWLYHCLKVGRRVDEKAYPPIYAPSCGLEMGFSNNSMSTRSASLNDGLADATRDQLATSKRSTSSSTERPNQSSDPQTTGSILPLPAPQYSSFASALASVPPASIPLPLSECTDNLPGPSPEKNRSVSSLSSLSEILGKIGKEGVPPTMEKPNKRPRGKLRGRVAPGTSRPFSRTPSLQSSTPSQQEADISSVSEQQQMPIVFSQAVKYMDEDDENERKLVQRKLNPDVVPAPTQRTASDNTGRAVDVASGSRRSKRRPGF